jgi:hypothetical protein
MSRNGQVTHQFTTEFKGEFNGTRRFDLEPPPDLWDAVKGQNMTFFENGVIRQILSGALKFLMGHDLFDLGGVVKGQNSSFPKYCSIICIVRLAL